MSSASSTPKNALVTAKQNLCSSLSPADWKAYLGLLKQWFKRIITKETFDSEARKICSADRRCLQRHNDFLLAIFSTCQSPPSACLSASGGSAGVSTAASSLSSSSSPASMVAAAMAGVGAVAATATIPSAPAAAIKLSDPGVSPAGESGSSPAVTSETVSKLPKSGSQPASSDSANAAPIISSKSSSSNSTSHPASTPPAATVGTPSPVPAAAAVSAVASATASALPNASPSRPFSSSATSPAVASPTHSSRPGKVKKPPKVKKAKTNKISFHNNFTPTNPLAYCQQIVPKPPEEERGLSFTYRDRTLPDSSLIHGRMLVGAWDVGLEMVDEAAVRFLQVAVETHVRTLLLKLVKDKSSFKLRDGRFPTQFSAGRQNFYSRQSDLDANPDPTFAGDEEASAAFQLSSAVGVKRKCRSPLRLSHLRDSLQRNRNVVASHTVYAINMERILNSFEHQTVEAAEIQDEKRENEERKAAADQRQILTRFW